MIGIPGWYGVGPPADRTPPRGTGKVQDGCPAQPAMTAPSASANGPMVAEVKPATLIRPRPTT